MRLTILIGQLGLWVWTEWYLQLDYPWQVLPLLLLYAGFSVVTLLLKTGKNTLFLFLLVDVCELFLFIYFTGGASNPFAWFLLIPILVSATLLSMRKTWMITALCLFLYSLLYYLHQTQTGMQADTSNQHVHGEFGQHIIGMWLGFIVIAVLMAWVIGTLVAGIQRREQQLLQAQQRSAEDEKLVALGTLATGAAHELGTPLASIQLLIGQLLELSASETEHKKLNLIRDQIQRCKQSLAQITAATGTPQALAGSHISIAEFMGKIKQEWAHTRCQLTATSTYDGTDLLWFDKTLQQAIINILNNAAEAQATQVDLTVACIGTHWQMDIIDNGQGLSEQRNKFSSEKDFGLGLGLYLAEATVKRMHGQLHQAAHANGGTHITITLPKIQHV